MEGEQKLRDMLTNRALAPGARSLYGTRKRQRTGQPWISILACWPHFDRLGPLAIANSHSRVAYVLSRSLSAAKPIWTSNSQRSIDYQLHIDRVYAARPVYIRNQVTYVQPQRSVDYQLYIDRVYSTIAIDIFGFGRGVA